MMNRLKNLFKQNSHGFWSGFFIGTSYIPFPPWAIFFGYVPLWIAAQRELSPKRAFILAWWTQFILTIIGFHWISYTAAEFGQIPWPAAILALLLFAGLIHIYIPISVALVVWIKSKIKISEAQTFLLFAISLILWERVWPSLFPWHLGYTFLWAKLPIYNWADIIGFEGLSSFILLVNAGVAYFWINFKKSNQKLIPFFAPKILLFITLFFILNWAGFIHGKKWNQFDSSIDILGVQANIGNFEKIYAEKGKGFQDDILEKFIKLTDQGLKDAPQTELIVWPETAYPDYLDEYYQTKERSVKLRETLKTWNKSLLTGSFSKDHLETDSNKNTFNAVFLLNEQGKLASPPYHKTYLLAFGEYLPLSETFPILLKLIPQMSNFGRGHGPQVMTWTKTKTSEQLKIGPQVCYEGLYPKFTRSLGQQDADLLVNVTNDSWFGKPFEPRQHMTMTLARSIEARRPLIRATNTGITTVGLANGHALQESPIHQEWVSAFHIEYKKNAPKTFYVKYGDIDFWMYLFLFFAIIGINKIYVRT